MRTENDILLLKKIWAILLQDGHIISPDAEWNYYGGNYDETRGLSFSEVMKLPQKYQDWLFTVKTVGVDWEQIDIPEYEYLSEFCDSFSASDPVDVWRGVVILLDGSKTHVYARDIDLHAHVDRYKSKAVEEDLVAKFFG